MTGLLPRNATPVERTVEALASHVRDLPVPIRHLWNPATCPAAFLPWLAWAWSVDHWRTDWDEATKRAVIAASPRVHRLKGTVAAVRAAIAAFGAQARVIEWWTVEGQAVTPQPHTAVVEARLTGPSAGSAAALIEDIRASAEAAAPEHIHLSMRLAASAEGGMARVPFIRRPATAARFTVEV